MNLNTKNNRPNYETRNNLPANSRGCYWVAFLFFALFLPSLNSFAQVNATVSVRTDARQISIGDQARVFIEAKINPSFGRLQWASIPDTFNNLEVVERGKIDTINGTGVVTYRQRLLLTGFDSGIFSVPPFVFPVIPNTDTPYTIQTDSFQLIVQTVSVDTTKAFKGIKGIINVKSSWRDYVWYIGGGILLLILIIITIIYFTSRKKSPALISQKPSETLQEKTLRQLSELNTRQLWQKNQVKEYYVELTDIVRNYIELRFQTPALELTTDELLYKTQLHRELLPYHALLSSILHTADLAKFAKAQPLPQEHIDAMEKAKQFVETSMPIVITETPTIKTI